LDFTHLFRGFRLAINPAKLAIALLAIFMIYTAGRIFDLCWGMQAAPNEIQLFAASKSDEYTRQQRQWIENRPSALGNLLSADRDLSLSDQEALSKDPSAAYKRLKQFYEKRFENDLKTAADLRAEGDKSSVPLTPGMPTPAEVERDSRAAAASRLLGSMEHLKDVRGRGIFATFLHFETNQFSRLVDNTLTFVRVTPTRETGNFGGGGGGGGGGDAQTVSGGLISLDPDRIWRSDTVAGCLSNMVIIGPRWLFTGAAPLRSDSGGFVTRNSRRALYLCSLLLFAVFSLIVIAFAGASIARLSALELAGIERAPLKDVFAFAASRLWTFIKSPVAPFLILLALGLVITLISLAGAIPWIGPILIGIIFIAFIGIAFILMLLLLGILGGFNLLYPTIAVEGADSFDAMSRSFAYVYARPWRLIFYTVTSLIYGVITFLFVAFAAYLVLLLTHTFVGWGMNFFGARYGAYSGSPLLETMWPSPTFLQLIHPINWYAMSLPEKIGAGFLHFWVFLVIAGTGAYVVSYYFSTHTIIYLLLRRSVDGQGLKEIFLEK
ncbi:MAG TPA: hypothetical protein VHM90_16370, partial [Phycisphaerae bacterium]|nr:hypothetical protein [Phycisphaerae bacterium]